jgi:CheY-like chemotaxis protein
LNGARVAIISASQIVAQSAAAAVRSLGGFVAPANDVSDVLLLDWRMDYSAAEIADLKREAGPVIALIAQEERSAIERARAAGVDHYTLKPVRRRSLAERIRLALGDAAAESAHGAHDDIEPQAPTGQRVLLAEDNPINALLARTLLARMGLVVDVAHDGEEAVAAAASAPYDLILLDLRMPRLDGFAAAERIRALPGAAGKTPLVALTADAGEEERARAQKAGMDGFLTKPIDAQRLANMIARFTASAKAARL